MHKHNISKVLNNLCRSAHSSAAEKGFWNVQELIARIPKDKHEEVVDALLGQKLALIHTEISEATESLRDGQGTDDFLEELSDVVLRVFDLVGFIDEHSRAFGDILLNKMEKNKTRKPKHGRRF